VQTIEAELVRDGRKRDERGRRIVEESERERLLAAYESSGLTQKEFARREGVKYPTFVAWLARKRRGVRAQVPAGPVNFRQVLIGTGGAAGLEVGLPDGTIVRGARAGEVAELVRALRS
jgi:transposase-like protein